MWRSFGACTSHHTRADIRVKSLHGQGLSSEGGCLWQVGAEQRAAGGVRGVCAARAVCRCCRTRANAHSHSLEPVQWTDTNSEAGQRVMHPWLSHMVDDGLHEMKGQVICPLQR